MNITNIKEKLKAALYNDFSLRIYAVFFAVIAWFFVSAVLYPNTSDTIANIPVTVSLKGSSAERNELSIVNLQNDLVTVTIEGSRTVIGNIKSDDLIATALIENVNSAGEYTLPIEITSRNGKDFNVTDISPKTINVNFDRIISKTFPIEASAPSVKIETGFLKQDVTCSPNTITVTGPESEINQITRCIVKTKYSEKIRESHQVNSSDVVIYNNNTVVAMDNLTINNKNFSIQIPVYMRKTIPLKLSFQNIPSGFLIEELGYTMDTTEIEIAAPNESIVNVGEIHLGYMDLREVDIGTIKEFPIDLPEGYINLTGTEKVIVTFDTEGLSKKGLDIKSSMISVVNAPAQYDIIPVTVGFAGVTFIGPTDIINNLTVQDVVAQLDLLSINVDAEDYFKAPVRIFVPYKGAVWAVGSHTAAFESKLKTEAQS